MANKSDFITEVRAAVTEILKSMYERVAALGTEYDMLDYANQLTDEDFVGENADLTAAELKAGLTAMRGGVKAAMDGNGPTIWPLKH